jgi:hypothetical protein
VTTSSVDRLRDAYARNLALPWQHNLAPPQRVWIAVYPPGDERRLRLHLPEFRDATTQHGHPWAELDVTTCFERWMAAHEYRDAYFAEPELLDLALPAFFDDLVDHVRSGLVVHADPNGVVALLGAGALFGLGPTVKVSALVHAVSGAIEGRLLVFFPGEHRGNTYRLLDARDGWNYLATLITANGGDR